VPKTLTASSQPSSLRFAARNAKSFGAEIRDIKRALWLLKNESLKHVGA
jgi:hypothetical protein